MASRRGFLAWAAAGAFSPGSVTQAATAARGSIRLAGSWAHEQTNWIGVITATRHDWRIEKAIELPSRMHGLAQEPGGYLLAVARRPGDWMMRWHPASGSTQWHWPDDDNRFNGHVSLTLDHDLVLTTETQRASGAGQVGVRSRSSLIKCAEWPTHGQDPHQLLVLPQRVGVLPAGTLMVANGGIQTQTELGRARVQGAALDASLVALAPDTGQLLGKWTLDDPWLSIRHLAWQPETQRLGVALQAEHPDRNERLDAPVLAIWDGTSLRVAPPPSPKLAGYAGDILAVSSGGFAVGCPRADQIALFDPDGAWQRSIPLLSACGLAGSGSHWWASAGSLLHNAASGRSTAFAAAGFRPVWDNHLGLAPQGATASRAAG